MTDKQTSVDVIIRIGLTQRETETAEYLGLSAEEYAQRMISMINYRGPTHYGRCALVPNDKTIFKIEEIYSGK